MPKKTPATPPADDYATWKSRAMAELTGPTTMTERHWRQLFIRGKSSGEAAQEAETHYRNTRPR